MWFHTLYEKLQKETLTLDKKIKKIKQDLKRLPDGNLVCCLSQDKYIKWYNQVKGIKEYIPKSKRELAEQLAIKKYLLKQLDYLLAEQQAIENYLNSHIPNSSNKLLEHPNYQNLLSSFYKPLSQELIKWANADYPTNHNHPESLVCNGSNGKKVRSKSETIIDQALYFNKIPFRYECALQLPFATFYPDFTIRHPKTGETFYWEHFGLMDDPEYCKHTCSKINSYVAAGIIPNINLIMTFETKNSPLDVGLVNFYIEHYFL